MPGHTSLAPPAMLTPQGRPDHALDAKVGLIELPGSDQIVDDGFLLRDSIQLRHKARIARHAAVVEPCAETGESCKKQIQQQRPVFASGSQRRRG